MGANHIIDMYITASSATDIYYLIRKHLHNASVAKQVMGKLFSLMGILEVGENECIEALASQIADYEDAVAEKVEARNSMEYIVTHNIKDYQFTNVKVILPEEFINLMEQAE